MGLFARKSAEGMTSAPTVAPDHLDPFSLTLNVKAVSIFLSSLLCIIVALHCLGQFIRVVYGYDYALGFVPLFFMYSEQNIPTWFSSIILLLCSGLLYVIAIAKKNRLDSTYRYWLFLCFAFLLLSADETAMIHEKIGQLTNRLLPHALPSAWAIPYTIVVGVLGVTFARFLLSIPQKYRILFSISGALYVGGALGIEFFEIMHILGGGEGGDLLFVILVTIEETMEISSSILFLYSLLMYLREHVKTIQLNLR